VRAGNCFALPARRDVYRFPVMDHESVPMPVCASQTPPARPLVWPLVPSWSTGDTAYPHSQHHASK
jgi:hypothetical protein